MTREADLLHRIRQPASTDVIALDLTIAVISGICVERELRVSKI